MKCVNCNMEFEEGYFCPSCGMRLLAEKNSSCEINKKTIKDKDSDEWKRYGESSKKWRAKSRISYIIKFSIILIFSVLLPYIYTLLPEYILERALPVLFVIGTVIIVSFIPVDGIFKVLLYIITIVVVYRVSRELLYLLFSDTSATLRKILVIYYIPSTVSTFAVISKIAFD